MSRIEEKVVHALAKAIPNSKLVDLGTELGVENVRCERYRQMNIHGEETPEGTRQMLFNWRDGTKAADQHPKLRKALEDSDLTDLADKHNIGLAKSGECSTAQRTGPPTKKKVPNPPSCATCHRASREEHWSDSEDDESWEVDAYMPCGYSMERKPRGICFIFNTTQDRDGSQKDLDTLKRTFGDTLAFDVKSVNNPHKGDYTGKLTELQTKDHTGYDCLVIIVLAHGTRNTIKTTDGQSIRIEEDIVDKFLGTEVRSLVGKPKLFIIQSCQGSENQKSVQDDDIQDDSKKTRPNHCDILVCLAAVPGYKAKRYASRGTPFIQILCEVINKNYKRIHLVDMLTLVNKKVSELTFKSGHKQIPWLSHNLTKHVFFE